MRKRFEPQLELGQLLIEDAPTPRSRDGMADLVIALRELYRHQVYRERIPDIPESKLIKGKPSTGRPGMELWRLFVPARIRLSKSLSYNGLHLHAGYSKPVGQRHSKKKETEAPALKTGSFVLESNVHFPADYSLLRDCARKCPDMIDKLDANHMRINRFCSPGRQEKAFPHCRSGTFQTLPL